MKTIFTLSFAALIAAVSFSSCQSVSIEPDTLPSMEAKVQVQGVIPSTRAASDCSIKSEWTSEDWIYVFNGGKHSYFRANEAGSDASFTMNGSSVDWVDGTAYAAYPKSVKLDNGVCKFSFGGQTGLFEDLCKFNLMTASAPITKGTGTFSFESHAAVIAISAEELLYSGTSVSQVVISGENFSSSVTLSANGGAIEVSPNAASNLVVNNPSIDEDGYIYIALYPTEGPVSVDVYDNGRGHFFCTLDNAADLAAGMVTDITEAGWDGGVEISFNPSVSDWN